MKTIKLITLLLFASLMFTALSQHAQAGPPPAFVGYTISDDATGGDCNTIGVWDSSTKTCVLTQDVECITNATTDICMEIQSDDIVFNCKEHQLFDNFGGPSGTGVRILGHSGVKIKRCDFDNFDIGIQVLNSDNINILLNTFTFTDLQSINLQSTDSSYIVGNEALDGSTDQMLFHNITKNNHVIGNKINAGSTFAGFVISDCTNDSFIANSSNDAQDSVDGDGFNINGCVRSEFINNSADGNDGSGFVYQNSSRSTIFANIADGNKLESMTIGGGFVIDNNSGSLTFEQNISDNAQPGSVDGIGIIDNSTGKKTSGTANTYEGNTCDGNAGGSSSPSGLCTGLNP